MKCSILILQSIYINILRKDRTFDLCHIFLILLLNENTLEQCLFLKSFLNINWIPMMIKNISIFSLIVILPLIISVLILTFIISIVSILGLIILFLILLSFSLIIILIIFFFTSIVFNILLNLLNIILFIMLEFFIIFL